MRKRTAAEGDGANSIHQSPPKRSASGSLDKVNCPICGEEISHLTATMAELHVNGCLDVAVLEKKKYTLSSRVKKPIIRPKDTVAGKCENHGLADTKPAAALAGTNAEAMLVEIEKTYLDPEKSSSSSSSDGYAYVYDCVAQLSSSRQGTGKPLPSYKTIPGTNFTVDAFKYGQPAFCTAFFLTHFHSDHYGGLTKAFGGHIYCTRITGTCVTSVLGVNPSLVHVLPMNTRCIVHGVYVTLLDAEHCPGAAIVLFEIPQPSASGRVVRIVHTGDFRASDRQVRQILCVFTTALQTPVTPEMIERAGRPDPGIPDCQAKRIPFVDCVYLDTTYLDPRYTFPRQDRVAVAVSEFCRRIDADAEYLAAFLPQHKPAQRRSPNAKQPKHAQLTAWFQPTKPKPQPKLSSVDASEGMASQRGERPNKNRTLFAVGTYSIGKERLFIEVACALGARVYVEDKKRKIIESIASPGLCSLITSDALAAQVHAVPMAKVNMRGMAEYLDDLQKRGAPFARVVAFCPTGWSHAAGPRGRFAGPVEQSASPDAWPTRVPTAELDDACTRGDGALLASLFARAARLSSATTNDGGFGIDRLKPRGSAANVAIFPVPYSEHSSFSELARFVCSLSIGRVIPTVFSSGANNAQANAWLNHWQDLKAEFLQRAEETVRCSPSDGVSSMRKPTTFSPV
ncbi:repair protein PSO2 SNM1 [Coemansia erecta]|nr:repair protein PSO2 SNM1 [Coemansia erecta]